MSELDQYKKCELLHNQLSSNIRFPSLDEYYKFWNDYRGIALIFNHESFKTGYSKRNGTRKDGDDLKEVLTYLQFDVRQHMDLKFNEIKSILSEVSLEDHSNNDCLLVIVMSHGTKDGKISAADEEYDVRELWMKFIGDNCESLIGKPKLFFIQACRGTMIDSGVLLKFKKNSNVCDNVEVDTARPISSIPKLADLLVMYSTAEDHYAIRNVKYGSWFIQALCKVLKTYPNDEILRNLTRVNRIVACDKQGTIMKDEESKVIKQMPNFISHLTKMMFFSKKEKLQKKKNVSKKQSGFSSCF